MAFNSSIFLSISVFSFSILLFCSKNDRLFYEQKCLDGYQTYVKEFGYNIRRVAESNSGVPMHPNTKESIRKMWLDPDFRKRRNVPEAGERHGRLVLIELREKTAGSYTWLCKCDCGKEYLKKVACLRKGMTTSCGCYNSEMSSKRRKEKTGVITTFVELFGERIGIREAEKRLGIGKNVIARKARVKKITLQEATEYFINFKRKKSL